MKNQLKSILEARKTNKNIGVPSYCTANDLVLKALLINAAKTNRPVLIEATANQVNQFGGYTGMKPQDFTNFVYAIADEVSCPKELIILGGDHLGPLTFAKEDEEKAMELSKELVREYVLAGFTKIHLDTSMKVGSDSKDEMLKTEVIAKRGAILYDVCIKAFEEIESEDKVRPVFIIGSEVPIPGGATEEEEGISVTKVADFKDTVDTYRRVFKELGYDNAFDDIISVVVQPGVEFGDAQVFLYDSEEAADLCGSLKDYENICFEGHSTDYQTKECLKSMVEDGIAILKVGPALTYRLREALFALSYIENSVVSVDKRSYFIEVLEETMLKNPNNWNKHYHGDETQLKIARKYSYSDRCRYYMSDENIKNTITKLLDNLKDMELPMNILHQFMPAQYDKIMHGEIKNDINDILNDAILEIPKDYEYATI